MIQDTKNRLFDICRDLSMCVGRYLIKRPKKVRRRGFRKLEKDMKLE